MDNQLKQTWIDALLSGKYQQGKQYLKLMTTDGTFHCCLGVLCELNENHLKTKVFNLDSKNRVVTFADVDEKTFHYFRSMLPRKFESDCGLTFNQAEKLSEMNDSGNSFQTIAEYIKTQL